MLKLDTDKIKYLLELFSDLDGKYQNEVIGYIHQLLIRQRAENEVGEETEHQDIRNRAIEKRVSDMSGDILGLLKSAKVMDISQRAQLTIVLEKLNPGAFTKKDEISVIINSKTISMEEYFKMHYPGIDYESTRQLAEKNLAEILTINHNQG